MQSVSENSRQAPPARRRWLRFSLRTLLIAITALGVWLGLHVNSARRQKEAVEAIEQLGGWAYYDYQFADGKVEPDPTARSPWPAWLIDRTGVDLFHDVVQVSLVYHNDEYKVRHETTIRTDEVKEHLPALRDLRVLLLTGGQASDACLEAASRLPRLERLYCWDATEATDAGVAHLRRSQRLVYLHLTGSKITDESLRTLGSMPQFEGLALQQNQFTDRGLAHLSNCTRLEVLALGIGNNGFTDEGLHALEGLQKLHTLDVSGGTVTIEGIDRLRQSIPALKNVYNDPSTGW